MECSNARRLRRVELPVSVDAVRIDNPASKPLVADADSGKNFCKPFEPLIQLPSPIRKTQIDTRPEQESPLTGNRWEDGVEGSILAPVVEMVIHGFPFPKAFG